MKKKISIVVAVSLLALVGVAVAIGGSLNDPLISLDYLQNTFEPSLQTQTQQRLDERYGSEYDTAAQSLERAAQQVRGQITPGNSQWSYSHALLEQKLGYHDTMTLPSGTSILLVEGAATAEAVAGELVDITSGTAAKTTTLVLNHRYLTSESADIVITVQSESARIAIAGYYKSTASGTNSLPFTDVKRTDWHYGAVSYVYGQGLFGGVTQDQFWPQYPITRSMLATVLHRMAGEPVAAGNGGTVFQDVPAGAWYEVAVKWSAAAGIVNGMENNSFYPESNVTREQLSTMLYRYAAQQAGLDTSGRGDLSKFRDQGNVASWARESIAWAVSTGILNGDDTGALNPKGSATRAEAATMIQRFSQLLAQSG